MSVENLLLNDILNNNTLYEVYEDCNNKLQYTLDNGEKIKICEMNKLKSDTIILNDEKYFKFITGNAKYIAAYAEINKGNIPMLGSSLANECKAHYVKAIKDQDIVKVPCVTFNKDNAKGSRAFYRNYDFVMDRHHICIITTDLVSPNYLSTILDNILVFKNYGWGSNVANANDVKLLSLKIPKIKKINNKVYLSIDLQRSITKNIEYKLANINSKSEILNTIEKVIDMEIEKYLDNKIQELSKYNNISSLDLVSDNEIFRFIKGNRVTKSRIMTSQTIHNSIPIYSASKFDSEIFGFSNKDFLENNGNVIIENSSILLNADGSTGKTRIKKKGFAINDVVFAIEILDKNISLSYIQRVINNELNKYNLNYTNKLYENDLKQKNIKIRIPLKQNSDIDYDVIKDIDTEVKNIRLKFLNTERMNEVLNFAKDKLFQLILEERSKND
ncbi:MAG: hypothetical protein DRG78_04630 [Epsilonproteobacteria bacterium]|nr:MAG: hypothetical protein DRG78_04630 [Campylobacterota bacterium]